MADIIVLSTSNAAMSDYPWALQAAGGDPAISHTGPDARQLTQAVLQDGVCGMGDFRVTQRAAGANLTIDIAGGRAAVLGTSVTRQGRFIADSTGTVNSGTNLTVPGAGTRTHRVILRIRDKQASGTAYGWSLEVLEDTGSGMPALPASAIDLASVSVAAGTASITDSMITDRRAYACPHIPLAVTVLGADAATVAFTGIPGFIRGLELHWSTRCNAAGANFALGARINGDTGANYGRAFRTVVGNGTASGLFSTTMDVATYMRAGIIPGATTTAGLWGHGRLTIPKWRIDGTNSRIMSLFESGHWESASNASSESGQNYWVATTAPNSITMVASLGSLLAGSQFILKAIA